MISQQVMQSIGWALIHSLWQGLAIYLVVKIAFRAVNKADVRYGIGVIAMVLLVASFVVTFLALNKGTGNAFEFTINVTAAITGEPTSLFQTALQFVDQNIIWLLRFWILGLSAGLLRIAAGLWYINRLRRKANPVESEWMEVVTSLSTSLNITRMITMAEAAIASPMVVGFMKPVILFPVGLLSGLTMEQVETILVHELSHIRRQDYIINFVQTIIETIFFFNPFALLISSLIREERENCCDDIVIAKGISPITYVKTLAQLEAARSSSTLALGIAGNQNQLLNRIKRIMENSAKNDWGKGRLVPVALLFLGLICASWLSIGSEKKEQDVKISQEEFNTTTLVSDTSKENGLKVLKRKNNNWVLEEPTAPSLPGEFAVPEASEFPDIPEYLEFPPVPDFNFDEMAQFPGFQYDIFDTGDSIPGYRFTFRDREDWESFEKEFTEKFKARFKDFYDKNQKQFDKMLEEMKRSEITRDEARSKREAAEVVDLNRMALRQAEMANRNADIAINLDELAAMSSKIQVDRAIDAAMIAKIAGDQNLEMLTDQLQRNTEMVEDMARRYDEFQKVLVEHLVADGYLKAGESVDQLQINDAEGKMKINGKSIKEKDRIKYKALQDKYLNTDHVRLIPGRSE
jgi:bla regulator protein BlaR1